MKKETYLFDTHALIFWNNKELVKKGRIAISNVRAWKNEILNNTNIQLILS